MVERDQLIVTIQNHLAASKGSAACDMLPLVLLFGEKGLGKSTILHTLRTWALVEEFHTVALTPNGVETARFDRLEGQDGDDSLRGQAGDDQVYGGEGIDSLFGHEGNDFLYGNAGDDELFGGIGVDRLFGGADDDYLTGDTPAAVVGDGSLDYLRGQSGADKFVKLETLDLLLDFNPGQGDQKL